MNRSVARLAAAALLLPLIVSQPASAGPTGGALPPELIEVIEVAGLYGVPEDAEMVAANVTAVGPAAAGHMTVFACDEDQPPTSNINYVADATVPNLVLTSISEAGNICVSTFAVSDIIVDIAGYVPAGSSITPLPSPVRVLDSRRTDTRLIPAGATTVVPIAGRSGVSDDAEVVLFNLTAIGADLPGHLTAYPCDEDLPETSSVNFSPNQVVPNFVTSRVGGNGSVCIDTVAPVEILVDVVAYATTGITPLANPVRLIDTRTANQPIAARETLRLDIGARADVPATATAAVYNLTSVGADAPGYATSYPCDPTPPRVSNLNYGTGQVVANGTITKLSAEGELCIFTLARSHLIVDLIGFIEGSADYVPLTPVRATDTRNGWERTCDWVIIPAADDVNRSVRVLNVTTGATRSLDLGFRRQRTDLASINENCTGVLVLVPFGEGPEGVYELFFDGNVSRTPLHESLSFMLLESVHSLQGALLVGNEGGGLLDAATGQVVWDGPNPSDPVEIFKLSSNGIAAISFQSFENPGITTLETWDVVGSRRLSRFDNVEWEGLDISPDGRYIVLNTIDGAQRFAVVATVFGDVVDGVEVLPGSDAVFAGDGSLLLCVNFNGIFSWDLFGSINPAMTWNQFISSTGDDFCGIRTG